MTIQNQTSSVAVIIVTWNHEADIAACLKNILASDYPNKEIIVVDNCSTDKTLGEIRPFSKSVSVIANKNNFGFSKAMNQGIASSNAEYILSLNPDARVAPDVIRHLVNFVANDVSYGIAAPKMIRENKTIDCAGIECKNKFHFYNRGEGQEDKGQFDKAEVVFGATGACALYKRSLLEAVKYEGEYFDENFFAYKEDVDISWRANRIGSKTIYVPAAVVIHNRSFHGYLDPENPSSPLTWDRVKFELKNCRSKHYRFVRSISFGNDFFLLIKNFENLGSWRGWLMHIRGLPGIILFYLLFEPFVFLQVPRILYFLPKMFKKRRFILRDKKSRVGA